MVSSHRPRVAIVDDIAACATFFTDLLGFTLEQEMGAPFAIVARDDRASG